MTIVNMSNYRYNGAMKAPKWIGCIPLGSHGSGPIQKKYWKVVSDTVRIRDFFKYRCCISCGKAFYDWNNPDWQAGHYNTYAQCRGYSKFHLDNIFGQCSYCNRGFNGAPAGVRFKETIIERYGQERMDWLNTFQRMPTEKMYDGEIIEKIRELVIAMKELPAQPDYYQKIISNELFYA